MTTPFLTIVTRCCKRPAMLSLCIDSVRALMDCSVEQVFIVDKKQIGILRANLLFAQHTHRIDGEYVYILDDDTLLTNTRFVTHIREAAADNPGIIMVRSWRSQLNPHTLPNNNVWGDKEKLKMATTNSLTYVVRADLWKQHIGEYGIAAGGDWAFLEKLRDEGHSFVWVNQMMAETQQLGRGENFEKCKDNWFEQVIRKYKLDQVKPGDWRLRLQENPDPITAEVSPLPLPLPLSVQKVTRIPSYHSHTKHISTKHVILGRRVKQ